MSSHVGLDEEPRAQLEPEGAATPIEAGRWLTAWRLTNLGVAPLVVTGAWLPHGRFRAERQELVPPLSLGHAETTRLEFVVACQEEPDTVVENAFVILSVLWRNRPWRVFVRLTVTFGRGGVPRLRTERVTYQAVGSAGGAA